MNPKKAIVYGGGTFSNVTPHLSLGVPAFGTAAKQLTDHLLRTSLLHINLELTAMAHGSYTNVLRSLTRVSCPAHRLVTNDDVEKHLRGVVDDPQTKVVVMSCALCDFNARIQPMEGDDVVIDHTRRLESKRSYSAILSPEAKLLPIVRQRKNGHGVVRKDIFLVAFKTTHGENPEAMFRRGLKLLKDNSCNLVLVNDTKTRNNMIVTPEESSYCLTTDRDEVFSDLATMISLRSNLTFTQSTVISGELVPWGSDLIPSSLREIVDYCIQQDAYQVTGQSTVGHFAVKLSDTEFLTSVRRSNFNDLGKPGTGMVRIRTSGPDTVLAYGAKPSVGGQSQRQVFFDHPGYDCILHFHCKLRHDRADDIPIASQFAYECGSLECGKNTSNGLREFRLPNDNVIKVVMLDNHGPNIVFNRYINPDDLAWFINRNWDLSQKTTGLPV